MPDQSLERGLGAGAGRRIVGIDEAGRGPWAGPVVAAAVWLESDRLPPELAVRIDDSKRIAAPERERLADSIEALAVVGLGTASVAEIDRLNILQASLLAMQRAVANLSVAPDAALVDGLHAPDLPCPCRAVVKGDARSLSIAAASIVAKVRRDRVMEALAERYPGYGWERNRGYGTTEHRAALARLGPTPQHRRSFRPVRDRLSLTD